MFFVGLGTAAPAQRYTKADCWDVLRNGPGWPLLDRRGQRLLERVLTRENGMEARHLSVERLEDALRIDPDTLQARYAEHAPRLACEAAKNALADAGLAPADIDAVIVSSCTGYLCPALSSYVVERVGLRSDVLALDLVGQGCGAALPNLRTAWSLIASGQSPRVLSICVEVSSAAMYLDSDPGVLISACLFGDGAGAAVLEAQPRPGRRAVRWETAASHHDPSEREALRFEHRGGLLRNILSQRVPYLSAGYAQQVLDSVLKPRGLGVEDIRAWIWHAGGRNVLLALRERLGLHEDQLRHSSAMLREYGNISSAFVYFVLQAALDDDLPDGWWWLASFGAGFSSHGALLHVGDA